MNKKKLMTKESILLDISNNKSHTYRVFAKLEDILVLFETPCFTINAMKKFKNIFNFE